MHRFLLAACLGNALISGTCFCGGEIVAPQAVVMATENSGKAPKAYGTFRDHVSLGKYEQESCPICLNSEEIIDKAKRVCLPCAHMVCKTCYEQLNEKHITTCPLCREPSGIKGIGSVTQQIRQNRDCKCYYRSCTCDECVLCCSAGTALFATYFCCITLRSAAGFVCCMPALACPLGVLQLGGYDSRSRPFCEGQCSNNPERRYCECCPKDQHYACFGSAAIN